MFSFYEPYMHIPTKLSGSTPGFVEMIINFQVKRSKSSSYKSMRCVCIVVLPTLEAHPYKVRVMFDIPSEVPSFIVS